MRRGHRRVEHKRVRRRVRPLLAGRRPKQAGSLVAAGEHPLHHRAPLAQRRGGGGRSGSAVAAPAAAAAAPATTAAAAASAAPPVTAAPGCARGGGVCRAEADGLGREDQPPDVLPRRLGRVDRPQQLRAARLGPQQPHEHHGGERGEQQRPRAETSTGEAGGGRMRGARKEDRERTRPRLGRAAAEKTAERDWRVERRGGDQTAPTRGRAPRRAGRMHGGCAGAAEAWGREGRERQQACKQRAPGCGK